MGRLGTEALEHIVFPKPSPRAKAQTWAPCAILMGFHTPELVIRSGQGQLSSAAKGPFFPQIARRGSRCQNPLEAHSQIQLSPEFIGCWTCLRLPCPSLPTHTYHPTVPEFLCAAKILHPQLSSHSALEVNIIKYTLILKYSVSILQCVSKVRLSHVKRSLN